MTVDAVVCSTCDDKGTVPIRQHADGCGIRCASDCPRTVYRKCPACAARELGDDLDG